MMRVETTDVFDKWLKKLKDREAKAQVIKRIERIIEQGHFGDTKELKSGVWELRIFTGPGYRVYYTMRGDTLVLLLTGSDKDSQRREIKKAIEMAGRL